MSQMTLELSVAYQFLPKTPTTRSSVIMDQFGIGFEQGEHIIAHELPLKLRRGEIVLFTGESGSGKSSLLRAAARELSASGEKVVSLLELEFGSGCLVDQIPGEPDDALALLAMCGLGEAQLLLRTPQELSDGQRFRFALAYAIAQQPDWILADEFTAALDRRVARVISANLRRLSKKSGTGFLLATTHETIVGDVAADHHLHCELDGTVTRNGVEEAGDFTGADSASDLKKKRPSSTNAGSPLRPRPTGRTSLGGIIAATTSG